MRKFCKLSGNNGLFRYTIGLLNYPKRIVPECVWKHGTKVPCRKARRVLLNIVVLCL